MAVERFLYESNILLHNTLGDPHKRTVTTWIPNDYKDVSSDGKKMPVMFALAGFLASGHSYENWQPFKETLSQRLDRLYANQSIGPCIVVMPDCFTSLGGNQYLNSSAIGDYASYINKELIQFIDKQYKTYGDGSHRACFGKSSGGYGSLCMGFHYPENWAAIACHSGDAYFDFTYRIDWPKSLNELAKYRPKLKLNDLEIRLSNGIDDGRINSFLRNIKVKSKVSHGESHCLMNLAMAASYDPDPSVDIGFRVPFHLDTGEIIQHRWDVWLRNDPINLISNHQQSLKRLKLLFIDCGSRDQYQIHFGARQLSKQLSHFQVDHTYEEFDDTHSGIDYRLDKSLPRLYEAIC
jgi:enterochelin esterase-like enzyme